MNLLTLDDQNLSALHQQVSHELGRRARAATVGLDAAAIIYGNEVAKRAMLVAVAGSHSILFVGPSRCGKTMIRAAAHVLGLSSTFEYRCCPCGNHSDPRAACTCTPGRIRRHLRKMPAADITVEMVRPSQRELNQTGSTLDDIRRQIAGMSQHRSIALGMLESEMLGLMSREMPLDPAARQTILGVARTIANLDGSERIEAAHLPEAANYRALRLLPGQGQ